MNLIEDGSSSPLGQIAGIFTRRRWQIILTFLLIVAIVAAVTFTTPKQYQTRMKILVKNERADTVVSAGSNNLSSLPAEVSETQINTEIELLNNNDLLREVARSTGLVKPGANTGSAAATRSDIALENAAGRLQHDLKITPVRKADIIEVDYTAEDPHLAVAVLRQLAASYFEAHLRIHGTPGTQEFFASLAAEYRSELKDVESKLTDFRVKNNIVLFASQKEEILRSASESTAMLLATETAIRETSGKISDARAQIAKVVPRVVTQSRTVNNQISVDHLGTILLDLQNRRTQLLAKFRPEDRTVQEVSQEIEQTQTALEKAKTLTGSDQTTDVNPIRATLEMEAAKEQAELAGLEARRQTLTQQTDNYRQQLSKLNNETSEYDDLIRKEKEVEENYSLYARKAEEARIANSLDQQKIANVAIAENPVEPHVPSKPDVALNLMEGIVLATFMSLGIAFSAEYLSKPFPQASTRTGIDIGSQQIGKKYGFETIDQSADLEDLTGLPVLAVMNRG